MEKTYHFFDDYTFDFDKRTVKRTYREDGSSELYGNYKASDFLPLEILVKDAIAARKRGDVMTCFHNDVRLRYRLDSKHRIS